MRGINLKSIFNHNGFTIKVENNSYGRNYAIEGIENIHVNDGDTFLLSDYGDVETIYFLIKIDFNLVNNCRIVLTESNKSEENKIRAYILSGKN